MFELVLSNLNHTLWGVQFHANMVVDPVEQFGRASREGTELSICVNLFQESEGWLKQTSERCCGDWKGFLYKKTLDLSLHSYLMLFVAGIGMIYPLVHCQLKDF